MVKIISAEFKTGLQRNGYWYRKVPKYHHKIKIFIFIVHQTLFT
jgi:hypothetical protein